MAFNGIIPAEAVEPAPHGLFNVADVDRRGVRDDHWGVGFSAMSEACTFDASIIDICGAYPAVPVFTKDGPRFSEIRPFGIVAYDRCLSIGFSAEDRMARAIRQLDVVSQKAVETELWTGGYTGQLDEPGTFLASTESENVGTAGTAQPAKIGLALLEQGLASCNPGAPGVIHMSVLTASILGPHLEVNDDGKLQTIAGNLVVVGSGYDGRGPGDTSAPADPFTHWMYATGKVYVVLGSEEATTVTAADALDTKTNEMTYAAERPAAVYTDGCCQLAVQIDIRN